MPRLFRRSSKKAGQSPGTMLYIGESRTEPVRIEVLNYDKSTFEEKELTAVEESFRYRDSPPVSWINVSGVHQVEIIEKLGEHFGLHPLVLEDIVNTGQRAKLEQYDDYLFVVLRVLDYGANGDLNSEQVSLVLGQHFVLSFRESTRNHFESVKLRLRSGRLRIRSSGPDYLAYALIDTIVDSYFSILEQIEERIENLEDELLSEPSSEVLEDIHALKRQMIFLRKSVWPLREVVNSVQRSESKLIKRPTEVFFRDVYDHVIQVIDAIENFREILSGLHDVYLSVLSNNMNAVMKVLSIIATIFIPLTFIAGIYGMNFEYMPELQWRWGYFVVVGVMVVISLIMVFLFKKKNWL